MLLKQKISDNPILKGFKREVEVISFSVNDDSKQVLIAYKISQSNPKGEDVTTMFQQPSLPIIADNNRKIVMIGEDFKPIPNPDYDPHYKPIQPPIEGDGTQAAPPPPPPPVDNNPYMTAMAYDYVVGFLDKPISCFNVIRFFIQFLDGDKFFDN